MSRSDSKDSLERQKLKNREIEGITDEATCLRRWKRMGCSISLIQLNFLIAVLLEVKSLDQQH